ncbi:MULTISPECIES: flagellin N-terminal helical domain-containing protein [Acidithiobacillus]|jgi:flagellin|uniref:Flagellin n=3 Tax=Acidithiobacillus caldus TaxID=33059 RepID=F9ZN81_ACICS|nr:MULTISPECIES: flagellin [Acidithiobacillus]AEK58124.1 Flagellin protein flaB [Acidithiobacillus caldus SM-1]AIA55112.1 Flagellin protein FlaB [Acidithiobacillus caldus ATCC 51756]AUW32766.1 flagellar protein FlaB [Acidithiobacillus caldus]MBU2730268.1 flagellar protein FlaB [Acidithiobacillus caldus]MBU2734341.1 flagellar protein FlaB [Acidithiobacillus caldus ATCC 51756]
MSISGIINTNVSALNTLNALNGTQGSLNTYLQQLSTGKSINGPQDNPAGYAIAQRFQTQINGLNQAISNGNQGVSLVQTATGAIQNQTSLLQQIRTTAVQAANASNTTQDRQALQGVVSQLLAQVQTIATQTQFNGQNILDGTFAGAAFQVGANSNQIINVSVGNTQSNAMGNYTTTTSGTIYGSSSGAYEMNGYAAGGAFTVSSGAVGAGGAGNFVKGTTLGVSGSVGSAAVTVTSADESAYSLAQSVNQVSAQTGVSASAYTSTAFTVTTTGSISFTLSNGSSGSPTNAVNISATVTDGQSGLSSLVTAINNQAAITGVSASTQTVNGTQELVLTQSQGQNIVIQASSGAATSGLSSGSTAVLQAVNGTTGASIGGTLSSGVGGMLIQGVVQFQSSSSYAIGNASGIGFSSQAASLSGSAIANINVSTAAGAQQAISILDQAINYLNQQNGALGAIQNRIQASVSNDQTTATNLQSAQSVVQDANIAQATSQLTKYQILQQAGISTLAQENALQQSYLKLLP